MTPGRRPLTFVSLDEIMPDVERLLAGHVTVGNWSLGQICSHLTRALEGTVHGFAERAPWIVRKTVGPLLLRQILKTKRFPRAIRLPQRYAPLSGCEARTEAEALRRALAVYASHGGPLTAHPLADVHTRDLWDQFHCIHCAHHLSFAVPDPRPGPSLEAHGQA